MKQTSRHQTKSHKTRDLARSIAADLNECADHVNFESIISIPSSSGSRIYNRITFWAIGRAMQALADGKTVFRPDGLHLEAVESSVVYKKEVPFTLQKLTRDFLMPFAVAIEARLDNGRLGVVQINALAKGQVAATQLKAHWDDFCRLSVMNYKVENMRKQRQRTARRNTAQDNRSRFAQALQTLHA